MRHTYGELLLDLDNLGLDIYTGITNFNECTFINLLSEWLEKTETKLSKKDDIIISIGRSILCKDMPYTRSVSLEIYDNFNLDNNDKSNILWYKFIAYFLRTFWYF